MRWPAFVIMIATAGMLAGCLNSPTPVEQADGQVPTESDPSNHISAQGSQLLVTNNSIHWEAHLVGDLAMRIDVAHANGGECSQRSAVETDGDDDRGRFLTVTQYPDGDFDWYSVSGAHILGAHAGPVSVSEDPPVADASRDRRASYTHEAQPFPANFTTWVFAHGLAELDDYVPNGTVSFNLHCDGAMEIKGIEASREAFLFDEATVGGGVGYNIGLASTGSIGETFQFHGTGGRLVRAVIDDFGASGLISWNQPSSENWIFDAQDDTLHLTIDDGFEAAWTVAQEQPYYGGYFGVVATLMPVSSLDEIAHLAAPTA